MRRPGLLVLLLAGLATTLEAQASLVILARHAEKASTVGDMELSPAGALRADALARALSAVHLTAIVSSQYRRTRNTAEPSARAQHLEITVIETGRDLPAHAAGVARVINLQPPGSAVLVVGHSNTLGPIIAALGGPAVQDLCDDEYSTLLILVRTPAGAPQLIRTRFGAAEPEETGRCHDRAP